MINNFAEYPESLTEARGQDTPRDTLIKALRLLDAGEMNPEHLVIVAAGSDEEGAPIMDTFSSTADMMAYLGMLEYAKLTLKD